MKKIIVALGLLVSLGVSAHAAADTTFDSAVRPPESATKIVLDRSSNTIVGMDITANPTSVVGGVAQMFSRVCVQNFDTAARLACSENALVSILASQSNAGTMIFPSSSSQPALPVCFSVIPGRNFFCVSSAVSSSRAGVMRGR